MISLAYITDLHLDEKTPADLGADARGNWNRIFNDLAKHELDMLVLGGDIGEVSGLRDLATMLQGYDWHVTPGNHDIRGQLRNWYRNRALESQSAIYFSVDAEGHRLIFLDSSPDMVELEQLQWLRTQVQTELPLIVFIHHPVLPVDTWVDKQYPLKNRGAVKNILHTHEGDVTIFCGHYHMDHVQTVENITQYVSPAASFQIQQDPDTFVADTSKTAYQLIHISDGTVQRELVEIPL